MLGESPFGIERNIRRLRSQCTTENSQIALCGVCKYTQELKSYQEQSLYPFCECIVGNDHEIVKCNSGEPDHFGQPIPNTVRYCKEEHSQLKECPKGYKLVPVPRYGIMCFESNVSDKKAFLQSFYSSRTKLYYAEIDRLESLFSSYSSFVWNTFNLNRLYRRHKINVLTDWVTSIEDNILELILESINETINNFASRNRSSVPRVELRKASNINDDYAILGFKDLSRLPTEEEIRRNYKIMSLKFHPDKNPTMDTSELFNRIRESYDNVCRIRSFN